MLGPDTPDEFPEFSGWRPPISRSSLQEFDSADAGFLLAEPTMPGDHGGHAHGGSKTDTFPPGWGPEQVREWVSAIIDAPADGHRNHRPRRPDQDLGFSLYGTYNGVDGVLRIRADGGLCYISTAHPYDPVRWAREIGRTR